VVDYLGREEIIYLGPDENITPAHIVWTVEQARKRGYPWPAAFMSSKPGAGMNHKEYGVTSLGVVVFMHEALLALGIDPRTQPFTIKMTGGPKGDVAGNALKLLFQDYGANARIVAMSDGHGAAFDPLGLDHAELLRLVAEQRSIDAFDPGRIKSPEGWVVSADAPENARRRANLHNKARADVFLPAGGRPETINAANWPDFLDSNGQPTAKAIVEGANLFLTNEARDRLQEKGVLIVHGSSANKTGVICSSYEILAGLLLSEEEFLALKDRYVPEVLDILRARAQAEARLLLREHKSSGGATPLTRITLELSQEINDAADEIYRRLMVDAASLATPDELSALARQYCPPCLAEGYGDRIAQRVPPRHFHALIAAFLASRIVYAEGLGWLKRTSQLRDLGQVIRAYLNQEAKLAAYLSELRASGLPDREEMARILEAGGRKLLTKEALELK